MYVVDDLEQGLFEEGYIALVIALLLVCHFSRPKKILMWMEFWFTEDGMYALKKVLIQSDEQLEFVNKEIEVSSLFDHPNLIRLLEHSIISVKVRQCYPYHCVCFWGTQLNTLFGFGGSKSHAHAINVF